LWLAFPGRIQKQEPPVVQHGGMRQPRQGSPVLSPNEKARSKEVGKNLKVKRLIAGNFTVDHL
jgi:hypothetical protein